MRDESHVERIVRATNHARAALLAGYTTYRDLGTEALGCADASLRDCINRGLIPGLARAGCSPLVPILPRASDAADGVNGVTAAVRRRVADGADVIKIYADYRRQAMRFPADVPGPGGTLLFPPDRKPRNPVTPLFSPAELDAIVAEAKRAGLPVAAHAGEASTALMAVRAGVTTVEHIFEDSDGVMTELIQEMEARKTIWVPTLATGEVYFDQAKYERCKAAVKNAFDRGVRIAAGGDTGVFDHGRNAREVEILVEAGIPLADALVSATVMGWLACGGDACGYRFGWLCPGNRADIIALDTDPRTDPKALRKVSFVMKDGRVWKMDGRPAGINSLDKWENDAGGVGKKEVATGHVFRP
jgi:imidazolonepropionase-like amidohydrolase